MTKAPNILHIFTDQQRFDTIRALGNPVIRTPNLDRLCRRGTAFTSAYTPSPVCIAARCSMIYGQYPLRTGCYANTPMPADGRDSFMASLAGAGYRCHGIGKCHFHPDTHALRGFHSRERQEELEADSLESEPYLRALHDAGYRHVGEPSGARGEMYYIPQVSSLPEELHPSGWVGSRSVAFIEEQAGAGRPWYLFSSYIHPHPPFSPPEPWNKLYRAPLMPLPHVPADSEALLTYVNRCQNRYKYRDQGIDHNLLRVMKAYYYACISFVDHQVGRLLDALEQTGQLDNTLILFTADHGEHLGDYNAFGKRSMHDSAARVPLIASLPGRFEADARCQAPASLVDLAPTFLAAAGASTTTHDYDGVDLAALQRGEHGREMVFAQHAYTPEVNGADPDIGRRLPADWSPAERRAAFSSYMAVSRDWKYIYSAPDDREFLFDRHADPRESRNRAGLQFCQSEQDTMRRALHEHLREGGETSGIDGAGWRRFPTPSLPANPDAGLLVQDYDTPWAKAPLPAGYRP